jgi:ketosteroid isomerase-like protein
MTLLRNEHKWTQQSAAADGSHESSESMKMVCETGSSRHPLNPCRVIAAVLALVVLALPLCAGLPIPQKKEENRHQIDKLEEVWRNALLTLNTSAMDSLLADDYMAITPSGTLQTKDETLASLRTGRVHFAELNISDRKVRFYGTTAVVTSLADVQATTAEGTVSGSYRYTRVYVRDTQGRWKIVSFEANRVREPGPRKRSDLH